MAKFAAIVQSGDKYTAVYSTAVLAPDGSKLVSQRTASLPRLPASPAELPAAVKAAAGGADKLTLESLDAPADGETGVVMVVHYGAPAPAKAAKAAK